MRCTGADLQPKVAVRAQGKVVDAEKRAHGIVSIQHQQHLGHLKRCRVQPLPAESLCLSRDITEFVQQGTFPLPPTGAQERLYLECLQL